MTNSSDITIINDQEYLDYQNSKNGCIPMNRPIEDYIKLGIINLDKQSGPTSHEVVSTIKNILNIPKAGHSGTLDPNVTGCLPIALQDATKILSTLLLSPKEYICNMQVSSSRSFEEWNKIINEFKGELFQFPPLQSNVAKKLRKRKIYNITVFEVKERNILLKIVCQAGTYIRTLCIDIGRAIGENSYMKELRRTKTGPFDETSLVTLHNLFDKYNDFLENNNIRSIKEIIRPVEDAILHFPKIIVKDNAVDPICHGVDLNQPGIIAYSHFSKNDLTSIMTVKNELVAMANTYVSSDEIASSNSGTIAHPVKVIMKRGFYPTYSK